MATIVFILLFIILLPIIVYFMLFRSERAVKVNSEENRHIQAEDSGTDNILYDEDGKPYKNVYKSRITPRRTYIRAVLTGKYRGEIDLTLSNQFQQSKFFDFSLYEVILENAEYSKIAFPTENGCKIPRDRFPKLLHIVLGENGDEYEVDLHEPVLSQININRKLHQNDGGLVFGTVEAIATGYLLDFVKEVYREREYIDLPDLGSKSTINSNTILTKTTIATGNVEHKGGYKRIEYFYSDLKSTYWSNWIYVKPANPPVSRGCSSVFLVVLGLIVGAVFLILILPQAAFFVPFLLIHLFLRLVSGRGGAYFSGSLLFLVIIGFIICSAHFFYHSSKKITPRIEVVETPHESRTEVVLGNNKDSNEVLTDTLIKHFRVWSDYSGKIYKGSIWIKKKDFRDARSYKTGLILDGNTENGYDKLIYSLKENDKDKLEGVYQLFDSLKLNNRFSEVGFAELIVSFIQDIPYSIVLPLDCDPDLYKDPFIKEYLSNANARCDGFEKFGINGPVEFMASLSGDCDTRTLLLYTIFSHYNYDVALLSSEYYGHSVLGINLPLTGLAYKVANKRYLLWETTASNLKPGVVATEISNLNYWRISLISK